MKPEIRQLLRDVRAAALIGSDEAVNSALDGLLLLPGTSSNERLNDQFIDQVILPVGDALAELRSQQLRPLLKHNLTVGRAIGAVTFAHYYAKHDESTPKVLSQIAADSRPEVRKALGKSIKKLSETYPERTFELGKNWLDQSAPKLQQVALMFIPSLVEKYEAQIEGLIYPLGREEDKAVRAELVNTLTAIARAGFPNLVLKMLTKWSMDEAPGGWVICRTLTSSWAASYPSEVKSILLKIQPMSSNKGEIKNTLKALKRHGLEISI
jgi:hypothetical protein